MFLSHVRFTIFAKCHRFEFVSLLSDARKNMKREYPSARSIGRIASRNTNKTQPAKTCHCGLRSHHEKLQTCGYKHKDLSFNRSRMGTSCRCPEHLREFLLRLGRPHSRPKYDFPLIRVPSRFIVENISLRVSATARPTTAYFVSGSGSTQLTHGGANDFVFHFNGPATTAINKIVKLQMSPRNPRAI